MKEKRVIIINGPNLNLIGRREPHIYGSETFDNFYDGLQLRHPDIYLFYFQSNHEGDIIDRLHENGFNGSSYILNAGGYTHTSIAIRDAIAAIESPVVEVHISDIMNREPFRKHSYLEEVCVHSIMGRGLKGYEDAITFLKEYEPTRDN